MKGQLARIQAYGKAHWKELLALLLAAIPAAFLLFHKGTQQAAANAISYIPATFGGGSGDPGATTGGPGGDPGTVLAPGPGVATVPAQTPWAAMPNPSVTGKPSVIGTSVNGSSPTSTPWIPRTGPAAPQAKAPTPAPAPTQSAGIARRNTSPTPAAPSTPVGSAVQAIGGYAQAAAQKAAAAAKTIQVSTAPAPKPAAGISRRNTSPPKPPAPKPPATVAVSTTTGARIGGAQQ